MLDADNVKRRKFYEVQSFFRDIRRYAPQLESPIDSKVAIVYDYDSLASFRIQRQSLLLDCETEMKKYHKFFYDRNVPIDIVPAGGELEGYRLLILPQMIVAKPEFQARLRSFVEGGGTLVLSYRDFAAAARMRRGAGSVYYLGCGLEEKLLTGLLEKVSAEQNISLQACAPGVEVICRGRGREALRLVMNHNPHPAESAGELLEPFQCIVRPLAGEPD